MHTSVKFEGRAQLMYVLPRFRSGDCRFLFLLLPKELSNGELLCLTLVLSYALGNIIGKDKYWFHK